MRKLLFASFLFVGTLTAAFSEQQLPFVSGQPKHIYDFAKVLSPEQIAQIEAVLLNYEDTTSTQIAVLIEPDLNGIDVYDRALFIAREWKIGQKDVNNGILLYISTNDHKYYTLVATGAQGKLNDGLVGEIQREYLVPGLKAGNYFSAVLNTVNAYSDALHGEFKGKSIKKKKTKFGVNTLTQLDKKHSNIKNAWLFARQPTF